MMASPAVKLTNKSNNTELAGHVVIAQSFWERTRGLLGRTSLPTGEALWIQGGKFVGCNSIHTLFMKFSIDAVFVDRQLVVKKIYRNLKPWKMTWPAPMAQSVFELPSGTLSRIRIDIGDQLHVGG